MLGGDRLGQERRLRAEVLAGDEGAWQALYDAAAVGLRAYVHWRCAGSHDMADDVVQDTWLTAVRRIRTFRPEKGPLTAWLRGIAANLIRNRLRQRRHPTSSSSEQIEKRCWHSVADQKSELVAQALAELPAHYEQVLRAKYLDGASVQAIADELGDSPKSVESLLTRARQALREAYQAAELRDG
jgi:RNA polymerase sigma-70 factor (ECF subfamily)